MLNIPTTFMKNDEDYITIPAIKRFIKSLNVPSLKLSLTREELMNSVLEYGNQSENNAEIVHSWIDSVIHEGIKDIYLYYVELKESQKLLFTNLKKAKQYLNGFIAQGISRHICANTYGKDFVIIEASLAETGDYGKKVNLVFCKNLYIHDKQKAVTRTVQFPITAEYYIDNALLLIRAKPRSNMFEYNPEGFDFEKTNQVTTEQLIYEVYNIITKKFNLKDYDKKFVSQIIKNRIFTLLDKYTSTPEEISTLMQNEETSIFAISESIKNICGVPDAMYPDVDDDIKNIVEKYLSINWKDKSIFSKDRKAYPVKLSATDEEESKVEQSAGLKEPLQTKALFFDNKKMLYKNRSCDGVSLKWKRQDFEYFPENTFYVRISVNTKGFCIFKFLEYTTKEDIEDVIFSIIDIERNIEQTAVEIG